MSIRTSSQRAATTHKQSRRRRLKAMGQWQDPLVPAEPVRQHLRKIHDATGMPYYAIAERIGLPHDSSLQPLLWGRGQYGPSERILRETADLVMAYWPTPDDFPESVLIEATGTRRRVEALAVRGWSRNWVARQIGMREDNFRKAISKDRVTVRLARRVASVYDAWWNQDPMDHGAELNPVARVRAAARRSGWHGPLAWDDDTIDDPDAVPLTDAVQPVVSEGGDLAARYLAGEAVILSGEARKEVLAHRFEWSNATIAEIADELGMTPEAAEQAWNRMKRKARSEGRKLWRRVYVPRLHQEDMEEAA